MDDSLGPRPVCILNPAAGGGDERDLRSLFRRTPGGDRVRIVRTERQGDPERLAREALRAGATALISAGGDGTLHGIVNGLAGEESRVPVAVLPFGTANDFVRSAGLPSDPEDAVAALATATVRDVDLIRVELERTGEADRIRRAVNACTGGIGGEVALGASDEDKARWGQLAYLKTAFDLMTGEREPFAVRIRISSSVDPTPGAPDGSAGGSGTPLDGRVLAVAVANGGRAGGGVPVAPGAEVDDRALDLVVIRDAPLADIVAHLPRLLENPPEPRTSPDREGADGPANVIRRRIRWAEIRSSPPMPWSLDGEPAEATRVRFDLEPGRLSLLVPRDDAVGGA